MKYICPLKEQELGPQANLSLKPQTYMNIYYTTVHIPHLSYIYNIIRGKYIFNVFQTSSGKKISAQYNPFSLLHRICIFPVLPKQSTKHMNQIPSLYE